jgi:hypothetical protein
MFSYGWKIPSTNGEVTYMTEDQLIQRCVAQSQDSYPGKYGLRHEQHPQPPAMLAEFARAEQEMGMALPHLMRRLYCEVGNGGWGPGYGFYPLHRKDDKSWGLVECYLDSCSETQADIDEYFPDSEEDADKDKPFLWPKQCVQVVDWGCNMYSTIDIALAECPVYFQDHNQFYGRWAITADSLHEWLTSWLDGTLTSRLTIAKARMVAF